MTRLRDDDPVSAPGPAAVAASRRGWSVVPLFGTRTDGRCGCGRPQCPSAGKHPRVRWERYQRARAAESTVRGWWRRWPEANVGVVTGSVSGLVVVDVDPRHGGDASLADLEAREGPLPATVEAFSGGGGLHLYLRHPGAAVPSGQLGAGLDVKADGGLVVAPPSRHASGHRYEWEPGAAPDEVAVAPVPAWVVDRLRTSVSRPSRVDVPSVVPRSERERREFAACWSAVGVSLESGDLYYRCPFHDDRHPSLHVDAEGCRWYCFGCRRGGSLGMLRRLVQSRTRDRARGGYHGVTRSRAPTRVSRARRALPGDASWMQWPGFRIGGHQDVVGEATCVDALEELAGGRSWAGPRRRYVTAVLVAEDDNPHDPTAVRVDVAGLTVGWVPRADAARVRAALATAQQTGRSPTARARLTGGWDRGPFGRGKIGVVLDVAPGFLPSDRTEPFVPEGPTLPIVVDPSARDALHSMLDADGRRAWVATLEEASSTPDAAVQLALRVQGTVVGRLDPAATARYLPLVRALRGAGLPATCAATLTGSANDVGLTCSLAEPTTLLEQ